MTAKRVVLAALMVVVAPAAVFAQSYAMQGVEHYLRVEASTSQGRRGPVVAGYVYNKYGQTADRVRLAVETVDGAGKVTSTKITEVIGGIPPHDRAYFEVPVDSAATPYRVRPLSFDPVGRGQ